jgi:hypothetical protein
MINSLVNILKQEPNLIGLKVSLEDEGIDPMLLPIFKAIADKLQVELRVKIGGPEARSDAKLAQDIGADAIVGPMIESAHGLRKFLSIPFLGKKYAMIETKFAIKNIGEFTTMQKHLNGFVFGRSDLKASYSNSSYASNIEENKDVDSIIESLLSVIDIETYIGGGFYSSVKYPLPASGYETRNVILKVDNGVCDPSIALRFEIELLTYLAKFNPNQADKYSKRIEKLQWHTT